MSSGIQKIYTEEEFHAAVSDIQSRWQMGQHVVYVVTEFARQNMYKWSFDGKNHVHWVLTHPHKRFDMNGVTSNDLFRPDERIPGRIPDESY